jgi:hypothetical protein
LLIDAIKADMARQSYVARRLKEVKAEMVERYQMSLSELEWVLREGKLQGWPKTKSKT